MSRARRTGVRAVPRFPGRAVLVVLFSAALALLTAGTASAHANLLGATPGDTAVVAQSPAEVVLRYDQPVSTALGAVKVLDPGGRRVDTGAVSQRDGGAVVVAALAPHLAEGTYTVLWRVLSADSHTIFGASSFSVGHPSATSAAGLAADQQSAGSAARTGLAVARALLYAGIALSFGALFFVAVLWPTGWRFRSVRRLIRAGTWTAIVATVAEILLQGPYAAGLPLSTALDPQVVGQVLLTRLGLTSVIRLAVLVLVAVGLHRRPRDPGRADRPATRRFLLPSAVGALVVLAGLAVAGHAGSGTLAVLATPLDVLHIAAACIWLSGIAMLVVVLLPRATTDLHHDELATVLGRWSRTAVVAVGVLVASGVFAAWRQIREWGALTGTGYGRILLVKVGLVVAIVALGAVGRQLVRRRLTVAADGMDPSAGAAGPGSGAILVAARPTLAPAAASRRRAIRRLRQAVAAETVLAGAVLVVTSILAGSAPARDTWFPDYTATAAVTSSLTVQVQVPAVRVGLDEMTLFYTGPGGRPTDVVASGARWTQRTGGSNVVPATLTRSGPGRYSVSRLALPAAGEWQLAVTTQTSDIDSETVLFTVRVR